MQSLNNDLLVDSEQLFAPKCSFCEHEMEISEGDVIYDSKWYHKSCWQHVEKQITKPVPAAHSDLISMMRYA